jgi:hypothetical protein
VPDVLIRGLSAATLERIDAEAETHGLSRNEYLRRQLEADAPRDGAAKASLADLRRAADAAQDLLDPEIMDAAWQ